MLATKAEPSKGWPGERGAAELEVSGSVTDTSGSGIPGVQVEAYVAGSLRARVTGSEDGRYALRFPCPELASDSAGTTVVVWWIPPATRAGLAPELAILAESRLSRSLGLWSRCIPRLAAGPIVTRDVVLLDRADKLRVLSESECLKEDLAAMARKRETPPAGGPGER